MINATAANIWQIIFIETKEHPGNWNIHLAAL